MESHCTLCEWLVYLFNWVLRLKAKRVQGPLPYNTPDFVSWWLQVESANITIAVFFPLFSVWSLCKPRAVYCSSFHFLFLISSPSCLRGSRLLVRTFVLVLSMPGAYLQLFRSPRITRIRSALFLSPYVSL